MLSGPPEAFASCAVRVMVSLPLAAAALLLAVRRIWLTGVTTTVVVALVKPVEEAFITVVPPVELPVSTTLVLPAALVVLKVGDRVPAAELLDAKLTFTPDVVLLLPLLSCN